MALLRCRKAEDAPLEWRAPSNDAVPALCVALALVAGVALALTFPPLTGRIVDQANIISRQPRDALEPKLAELEHKSGIQLVVATVSPLEGQEIEPYADQLFRFWKLGEKNKNNGVLLLVAPNDAGAHRSGLWPRRHADRRALGRDHR